MSKGLDELREIELKWQYGVFTFIPNFEVIKKELKECEQHKDFVQEICNYLGLDDLFPYNNLKEIEKQIKTLADNSHWYSVKLMNEKLKALEIIKNSGYISIDIMLSQNYITRKEYDLLKEVLKDD